MKNLTLLFVLFLGFHSVYSKSSLAPSGGIDTVKAVCGIKLQFADLNTKRRSFSQYLGEHKETPEEKTAIIGFFEGSVLKMINANYYGDAGKTESDLYLDASGVILVYAKVFEYESPISVNPKTPIKSMTENWYYFRNGEMIKWVSGGKVKPAGSDEFKSKRNALKEENKRVKNLFADPSKLNKLK